MGYGGCNFEMVPILMGSLFSMVAYYPNFTILLTKFCMYWVKLVDCVIPCVVINPRRACAVRVAVRGLLVILSVWSVCPVKLFQLHSGLNA